MSECWIEGTRNIGDGGTQVSDDGGSGCIEGWGGLKAKPNKDG